MLDDLVQDLRISARSLGRSPVLTATIVLTVGLGIGATTAIFAAVDAALLRPLPYRAPERLVRIYTDNPPFRFRFSAVDYLALQEQQTQFARTATYTDRAVTFSDGTTAELLRSRVVSWTYFSTLGLTPVAGRDFAEADGRPNAPPVAIVSHGFWRQRLGARGDLGAAAVRLDGTDYAVIGVLPPRVGPLEDGFDLFLAQQFAPPPRRGPFLFTVIARLGPGVDAAAATAELRAINRRIFPLWKSSYQDEKATWSLMDLRAHVVGDVQTIAGAALGAVLLVWLIACTNASGLLVARVSGRARELALRTALGASRGRLVRYLLAESTLLAAGSLVVGVLLARGGVALLAGVGSRYFPRMHEIEMGSGERWLLLALMAASAAILGAIPAVQGSASVAESVRSSDRVATATPGMRRVRRALVASQFAVATPLLVVAALLLVSLSELRRVDLGFDTHNVIAGSIRLPSALYSDPGRAEAFWTSLDLRLQALPAVAGVAFADGRPPNGVGNLNNFDLESRPTPAGQSQPATPWLAVTPAYFGTLGVSLVEGRLLDERDVPTDNIASIVVDRAWARRFFPGQSAVGQRLRQGGCTTCPWTTVVGVVSDVKYTGLDKPNDGTVYWALPRSSLARQVILRTAADPAAALDGVRAAVRAAEPGAPLSNVATIDELVEQSLDRPHSLSLLIAALAAIALTLSALGIYGVMSYYVQQHGKEIAVRMALGGRASNVLWMVVSQGMRVVAAGIAAGLMAAYGAARLAQGLLFRVDPADAVTFGAVALLMLAAALAACALPARRAVRVQPAAVLRSD